MEKDILLSQIKTGDVFDNPQKGISTVINVTPEYISYKRGNSIIHLPVDVFLSVVNKYAHKKCATTDLRRDLPQVFDSKKNGHSCNCTFLFCIAKKLGLVEGEIQGAGVRGNPYFIVFRVSDLYYSSERKTSFMKGDKYILLKRYLQNCKKEEVTLSFSDVEKIVENTLPNSAYRYPEWWANDPSHSQAVAWLDAGYAKAALDMQKQIVFFCLTDKKSKHTYRKPSGNIDKPKTIQPLQNQVTNQMRSEKVFAIDGYEFCFIQQLSPECKPDGSIKKFYPQKDYQNAQGLPLLYNGDGAFCRFAIKAPNCSGVYLWVVENEIIYIGETADLRRRFNQGYGYIAPRNCYIGGQSTNCKMNKVVLELYEHEELVDLYFYETSDYKQLELELLRNHQTKYNVKDNQ